MVCEHFEEGVTHIIPLKPMGNAAQAANAAVVRRTGF